MQGESLRRAFAIAFRICDPSFSITKVPLLVDIDTGFGEAFGIARTVKELQRAGVAAVHIEDQVSAKRCGHRPGKQLVPADEMANRIKACIDARTSSDEIVIMARTDAIASEGFDAALNRAEKYLKAGADMLFVGKSLPLPICC
jgi:methylisocitrate lyase